LFHSGTEIIAEEQAVWLRQNHLLGSSDDLKDVVDAFEKVSNAFKKNPKKIDEINEILQPPEKKSPEVSFLPIGAASETPTSAASATQTSVPVFSATDSSAPYSMAVRSIYNMVNA